MKNELANAAATAPRIELPPGAFENFTVAGWTYYSDKETSDDTRRWSHFLVSEAGEVRAVPFTGWKEMSHADVSHYIALNFPDAGRGWTYESQVLELAYLRALVGGFLDYKATPQALLARAAETITEARRNAYKGGVPERLKAKLHRLSIELDELAAEFPDTEAKAEARKNAAA